MKDSAWKLGVADLIRARVRDSHRTSKTALMWTSHSSALPRLTRVSAPLAGLPRSTKRRWLWVVLLLFTWQTASLTYPADGGSLIGVVHDEQGLPVADAKVTVTSEKFSVSALTLADGKFDFRNLAPSQYRITAEAAGYRKEAAAVTISRAGEVLSNAIILKPSSLHVAVFDSSSRMPLAGVVVALLARERGLTVSTAPAARTITDEGGDAYFGRLAPGSYRLTATLRGFEEYRSEVFVSAGKVTTEFALPLSIAPVIPINDKSVHRYGPPNLPSKTVQAIFQDSEGWMWFGCDRGVARFNGADFKSSATQNSAYYQLAGMDVRSIAEDRSGRVWLATPAGLRAITKEGREAGEALTGFETRHVFVDSAGAVWVATSRGVFRSSSGETGKFEQIGGAASADIRQTSEDAHGKIWIAASDGAYCFDGNKFNRYEGLSARTSRRSSSTAAQSGPDDVKDGGPVTDVRSVFAGSNQRIWVAAAAGLYYLDADKMLSPLKEQSGSGSAASVDVRAIAQDRTGRMWIASAAGGAGVYDPGINKSQRLSALDQDHVGVISTDREGAVWFGTDNGAVRADLYSFVNFNTSRGLSDNDVRQVKEDPGPSSASTADKKSEKGRLWFATAAGTSVMEGERLVPIEGLRANIEVRSVAIDGNGAKWFAADQGVFRLTAQALTQLNEGNGLASNNVRWVEAAAGGSTMVFATAKGVSIFKDGALHGVEDLASYDVRRAFESSDGRIWCSTSRGVVVLTPGSWSFDLIDEGRGLADADVRCVTEWSGRMAIATRAGIQSCEADSPHPRVLNQLDSEPADTLFTDRDGYLWAGMEEGGLKKFCLIGDRVVSATYSGENNAFSARRIRSISQDGNGKIWIATEAGALRHEPVTAAPLARVSLEMDGRILGAKGDVAAGSLDEVSYGRHSLTFHIAGASMSGQVRYLYRIQSGGADAPWQLLPVQPSGEREVPVFEIGEGNHSFEVIALNRDLYGAAGPAVRLSFTVGSPFWKRWWFYAFGTALAGAVVAAVLAARRARNREYVLPKELRSYVAIEPNPYIVGNPIRTEKMFYGREDDFRYVRTKLEAASQGVVIVFCGERRVGKSSILYQVLNGRLGDRFAPVFVDMQEMVVAGDAEFFARISRLISESVNRINSAAQALQPASAAGQTASGVTRAVAAASGRLRSPEFDRGNPYPVFLDFLDAALLALGDKTLLILIDEYELMEGKVDDGRLSPELFTFLAGLMDNKERLALIFTGSRRLEERDKKYWRELLRRSLFRKVGFLSENDTVRLITEPVAGRLVFGRGVVAEICRLTAGQAFYTQVMCQNLVDYVNEHRQNWLTLACLKVVIDEIIDNPLPQMIYAWDGLSDDEKISLSLLTESLNGAGAYATAAELRASVRENDYPVNLSENTIRVTLEELFRREMLDKDPLGGFRFKIDLLRQWIHRAHSIWQVVNEVRTH